MSWPVSKVRVTTPLRFVNFAAFRLSLLEMLTTIEEQCCGSEFRNNQQVLDER